MIYLIAFAALFACLDRLWGSDARIAGHGSHVITTVLCLALLWPLYHFVSLSAAALLVAWAIYRSIPFAAGAFAPTNGAEDLRAFVRHFWAVPLSMAALALTHAPLSLAWPFGVYWLAATSLALINGASQGRYNAAVEAIRGAAFGTASAFALGLV